MDALLWRGQVEASDVEPLLARYPRARGVRPAVQYDGRRHQTDRVRYVRDQKVNRALAARHWTVIRVIVEDSDADVIGRVAAALVGRGWRAA